MKIVDVVQRTPDWERWRAQGVTASEAAIVLGRSPYKTPWRLWAERTGMARAADLSANPHVRRGNALEDEARRAFEERHGTMLLPLCGESEEHPVLRASFDGVADDGAPVELKVPAQPTFAEVAVKTTESTAFRLYWPQVQHQLYVAGAGQGWLVFYGGPDRLLEFPIRARRGLSQPGAGARCAGLLGGDRQTQGAAARSGAGPVCPRRRGIGPVVGPRWRVP